MNKIFKKVSILTAVLVSSFVAMSNVDATRLIGSRTGISHSTEVLSTTPGAVQRREMTHAYIRDYDYTKGEAIRLFPNDVWKYGELEYYIKRVCNAEKLMSDLGFQYPWLVYERKICMYKFIDENIGYFREKHAQRSIMKTLIEHGQHVSEGVLTAIVNIVKNELRDTELANNTWTEAQKWSYLEEHYDEAWQVFFGQ